MVFNSIEYAIFLPLVFALYWFVFNKSVKVQNLFIVIVSYIFYGWWDWRFLFLIAFTSFCSWMSGLLIQKYSQQGKKAKAVSTANIVLNLAILGVFKYYDFFATSFAHVFLGGKTEGLLLNIVLPVGISCEHHQHHLRTQEDEDAEVEQDQDRVLDEHLDGGGDGVLHLVHVAAHPGDDVALALLREEADGEGEDLVVDAVPDVLDDAGADGDHHGRGPEVAGGLEGREEDHHRTKQQERRHGAMGCGEIGNEPIGVVHEDILEFHALGSPGNEGVFDRVHLEKDVQQRDNDGKRKDVEDGGQHVQDHRPGQVALVRGGVLSHHLEKVVHAAGAFRLLTYKIKAFSLSLQG